MSGHDLDQPCPRSLRQFGKGPAHWPHHDSLSFDQSPAEDNDRRVDGVGQVGQPEGEPPGEGVHYFECLRLSLQRGGSHVLTPHGLGVAPSQTDHRPQPARLGGRSSEGAEAVPRRKALPAASLAAGARRTVRVDDHMADFAGKAMGAADELTVHYVPASDPGPERDHHDMVVPLRRPQGMFRPARRRGVVGDDCGCPLRSALGQLRADVDAIHAMEVRTELGNSPGVDHPRAAHAEGRGGAGPASGKTRSATVRTTSTISAAECGVGSLSMASTSPPALRRVASTLEPPMSTPTQAVAVAG